MGVFFLDKKFKIIKNVLPLLLYICYNIYEDKNMAYFLRQDKRKKGIYLQICDSKRIKGTGKNKTTVYRTLGYLNGLIAQGQKDPITDAKAEILELNAAAKETNKAKIGDEQLSKNVGYFLIKSIIDDCKFQKDLLPMLLMNDKNPKYVDILMDLIYARVVYPCSKSKTYEEILDKLFIEKKYSKDDVYAAIHFWGQEYKKVIECFKRRSEQIHKYDTKNVLFDCANFYFEIDREDDLRRRGPSKETRKDPIIGMALLLDSTGMPLGMNMYPGNQSEKPEIRKMIEETKNKYDIKGRTIQIADKGLNCAKNIYEALVTNGGYIFSKSIKQLPDVEKTWVFLDNDFIETKNAKGDVVFKYKECIDDFPYSFIKDDKTKAVFKSKEKRIVTWNADLASKKLAELARIEEKLNNLILSKAKKEMYGFYSEYVDLKCFDSDGNVLDSKIKSLIKKDKIEQDKKMAGYNMIVTSEYKNDAMKIYELYHNLWKIEETFRVMKTDLNARPVYMQKENGIFGHFLICYLAVLLIRLLQQDIFKGKYSDADIIKFIRNFNVTKGYQDIYTNTLLKSKMADELANSYSHKITNLYLELKEIKKILNID